MILAFSTLPKVSSAAADIDLNHLTLSVRGFTLSTALPTREWWPTLPFADAAPAAPALLPFAFGSVPRFYRLVAAGPATADSATLFRDCSASFELLLLLAWSRV